MTRQKRLTSIFEEFDRCAKEFAENSNALFCEITSVYKKDDTTDPQKLKLRFAYVHYNAYLLEFKYTARTSMNMTQSVLECLIYPQKNSDGSAIPLPLFLDYCNVDTARPLCIPMICDRVGMKEAFACICATLCEFEETIRAVCDNGERRQTVLQAFWNEVAKCLQLRKGPNASEEEILPYLNYALYDFFTLRFTSIHFLNFLRGESDLAIKQLKKVKNPLGYEARVLRLWQRKEQDSQTAIPHVCEILSATYTKNGVQKQSGKELLSMLLAWLLLTVVLTPLYGGIYYLLRIWESNGVGYFLTSFSNIAYSFIFAFLTAIGASYFLRFRILKRFYASDYEHRLALDHLQNNVSSDRLIKGLLYIIIVVSLVGSVLLAKWNVSFFENGFVDNSNFFSVTGEYHSYNEVDSVYYKPDRVNDLGETIPFPSYVLRLKDGTEIDFYPLSDIEEYSSDLLDFLHEKGIPIDESQKR